MIHFRKEGEVFKRGLNITRGDHWISFAWQWGGKRKSVRFKWRVVRTEATHMTTEPETLVPRTEDCKDLPPNWKRNGDG